LSTAVRPEARDGKADILDVKGPDGFTARLFVDGKTHLPLMLTWMDKEPLSMMVTNDGRGGGMRSGGGGIQVMGALNSAGSAEDLAKMRDDMAARMAEAEAKRRVVEYRLFYGEYKAVDGLRCPPECSAWWTALRRKKSRWRRSGSTGRSIRPSSQ
jgi:hypothetical protein